MAMLVAGCSVPNNVQNSQALVYSTFIEPVREEANVTVAWVASDIVSKVCVSLGVNDGVEPGTYDGCAVIKISADGSAQCTIYSTKPKSFNDKPKLQLLGHELMHCFGAKHE